MEKGGSQTVIDTPMAINNKGLERPMKSGVHTCMRVTQHYDALTGSAGPLFRGVCLVMAPRRQGVRLRRDSLSLRRTEG